MAPISRVQRDEVRERALAGLARGAGRKGYGIAVDLLGNRAEAEDAVQEALARACRGYERLRDPQALEGWFFRVLTNVCMRMLRRRSLFGRVRGWLGLDPAPAVVEVVDRAPPPDEQLGEARDAARMLAEVDRLPAMQRAALVLRYGHDRSVAEIAGMLGVGEGTVKTHLVRALAALRESRT